MSTLKIGTRDQQTAYRPGDAIEGAIGWDLDPAPKAIEIRFFWHTRGKGTEDVTIVDQIRFERPNAQGAEPFRFIAPRHPPSFSGKLVSVLWALEVVALPGNLSARAPLVLGPDAREILLGQPSTT